MEVRSVYSHSEQAHSKVELKASHHREGGDVIVFKCEHNGAHFQTGWKAFKMLHSVVHMKSEIVLLRVKKDILEHGMVQFSGTEPKQ